MMHTLRIRMPSRKSHILCRLTRIFLQAGAISILLAACGGTTSAPASPSSTSSISVPNPSGDRSAASPAVTANPAPSGRSSPAAKPSAPSLRVGYTTQTAGMTPLWLADVTHAFSDRNLDAKLIYVEGILGTKSLIANELDVLLVAATSVIAANLNGEQDLVLLGSEFNHSAYAMNVAPTIKSAADLKGKVVATDQPGTSNAQQAVLLLQKLGLKPTDVTLRNVGGSNVQFAALLGGQAQATSMTLPFPFQAEDKGYPILVNTYDLPYQATSFVARRSRVDSLMPALVLFFEAMRQSIRAFNTQPELAKQVMQQYTKESDASMLQRTYDFYKKDTPFQEDLQPTKEGLQAVLDFLGETTAPAAKQAKPDQFIDTRVLSQLAKS